jgi:hypothetical protein
MPVYGPVFTVEVERQSPRGHRIELLNGDVHETAETEIALDNMLDILWICYGRGGRRMPRSLRRSVTAALTTGKATLRRRNNTLEM